MPNPSGENGGLFIPEAPLGDVKRQRDLARSAPISGGPATASALETPRRSGKQAQRHGRQQQPAASEPPPQLPVETPPPSYQLQVAKAWADIAATPGANQFPILAQIATAAQQQADHA